MLQSAPIAAMLPTRDIDRARTFYEQVLGLRGDPVSGTPGRGPEVRAVRYDCGGAICYLQETAVDVPAEHTVATWVVADIRAEVAELRSRGVTFEVYDLGGPIDDAVHVVDIGSAAWFRDLDGNILGLFEAA